MFATCRPTGRGSVQGIYPVMPSSRGGHFLYVIERQHCIRALLERFR
jgi:hypothetical protein